MQLIDNMKISFFVYEYINQVKSKKNTYRTEYAKNQLIIFSFSADFSIIFEITFILYENAMVLSIFIYKWLNIKKPSSAKLYYYSGY